jgi:pyridoxamine 5'-phosphate oxidase
VSAVASPQSDRVESPAALEAAAAAVRERHADGAVPRPAWWGGFVLTPTAIELWVEGAARLHERLRFEKTDDGWRGAYIGP